MKNPLIFVVSLITIIFTGYAFGSALPLNQQSITKDGDILRFDKGFSQVIGGIPIIHLKGTPYEMGWQRARLNEDIFLKGISFFANSRHYVLKDFNWFKRLFISAVANWRTKSIYRRYDQPILEEIQGIIDGMAGKVSQKDIIQVSSAFDLTMNYACTGFAAKGRATKNGRLIIGRNFDFGGAGYFDVPFITIYEPDKGYRFASFGLPVWNLCGVTSFNEKGLVVAAQIAVVNDANFTGKPIGSLLRKIIQYCATIDEALEEINKTPRMCGINLILAEGPTQRAVVVEISADDFAVREMENDVVWATNNFISEKMKDKIVANHYLYNFEMRYARMQQLLEKDHSKIDLEMAVEFLRDHYAVNQGRETVNNHTICATFRTDYPFSPNNALAMVFEPGSFNVWFSNSNEPAAMGEFIGFNLFDLFEGKVSKLVPAVIAESEVPKTLAYKRMLNNYKTFSKAQKSYERKNYVNAIIDLKKVITIEPDHINAYYYLAYTYFRSEKWDLAKKYAFKVIMLEDELGIPPRLRERTALIYTLLGRIAKTQGKTKKANEYFNQVISLAEKWPHANNKYAAKLAKKHQKTKFLGIF